MPVWLVTGGSGFLGRHLLELGMQPGPQIGTILETAFEAQLEGAFFDLNQGLKWLAEQEQIQMPPQVRSALDTLRLRQTN